MNEDLYRAVQGLVDGSKVRIHRDDEAKGDWQQVPSLWVQLRSSSQWGSGLGGSARFGSRPVISTGVVSLVMEIECTSAEAAVDLVGRSHGDAPADLRAIAATLKDADQIGWWVERVRHWTQDARSQLRLDPERPKSARGARCPECGARHVYVRQDGERVRQPALGITWVGPDDQDYHPDSDWRVRAVECRACGRAWFRGASMDSLVGMMLEANLTRETMADIQ